MTSPEKAFSLLDPEKQAALRSLQPTACRLTVQLDLFALCHQSETDEAFGTAIEAYAKTCQQNLRPYLAEALGQMKEGSK